MQTLHCVDWGDFWYLTYVADFVIMSRSEKFLDEAPGLAEDKLISDFLEIGIFLNITAPTRTNVNSSQCAE
jgi:hypothetical protein